MSWRVIFSKAGDKEFSRLDKQTQQQILYYVAKLEVAENPISFAKPLTGTLAGLWRYRVGKYRLICELRKNILTIEVITIDKRDTVYR
ncbi:MAG: type II toxin-antitoxin system RelE family toxin [Rickettsiales bacterium]